MDTVGKVWLTDACWGRYALPQVCWSAQEGIDLSVRVLQDRQRCRRAQLKT